MTMYGAGWGEAFGKKISQEFSQSRMTEEINIFLRKQGFRISMV